MAIIHSPNIKYYLPNTVFVFAFYIYIKIRKKSKIGKIIIYINISNNFYNVDDKKGDIIV